MSGSSDSRPVRNVIAFACRCVCNISINDNKCKICAFLEMSMRFSQGCKGMERTHEAPSNIIQQSMILGCHQGHLTTYTLHKSAQHIQFSLSRQWQLAKPRTSTSKCSFAAWLLQSTIRMVLNGSLLRGSARPAPISRLASYSWVDTVDTQIWHRKNFHLSALFFPVRFTGVVFARRMYSNFTI